MTEIRNLFRGIVFSNIYISLAAVAMTHETLLLSGLTVDIYLYFFVFFGTLFIYNLHRLINLPENAAEERSQWIIEQKKKLQAVTGLAIMGCLISIFYVNKLTILLLLPVGFMAIFYKLPKKTKLRALRNIPLLKIFVISLVWVLVTVILPMAEVNNWQYITWLSAGRFLFIFAITVPFDIRDLHSDREQGVITLPSLLGIRRSIYLSLLVLFIFIALVWFQWILNSLNTGHMAALWGSALITLLVVLRTTDRSKELFFTGLLDGMMILQWLLVYLFS